MIGRPLTGPLTGPWKKFLPPCSTLHSRGTAGERVTTYPTAEGRSSRKHDCPWGQEPPARSCFRPRTRGGGMRPTAGAWHRLRRASPSPTRVRDFGRLRVRCAHTRDRRRPTPPATLAGLAWSSGRGRPSPWQRGGPATALRVSSVSWSPRPVLHPQRTLISKRLCRATCPWCGTQALRTSRTGATGG